MNEAERRVGDLGAQPPNQVQAADVEAAESTSFAAGLRARVERERSRTKPFVLIGPDDEGDVQVTIIAHVIPRMRDLVQSASEGDAEFIVAATRELIVAVGKEKRTMSWVEVHAMLGLPEVLSVEKAVEAVVAGNESALGRVSAEIVEWISGGSEAIANSLM